MGGKEKEKEGMGKERGGGRLEPPSHISGCVRDC